MTEGEQFFFQSMLCWLLFVFFFLPFGLEEARIAFDSHSYVFFLCWTRRRQMNKNQQNILKKQKKKNISKTNICILSKKKNENNNFNKTPVCFDWLWPILVQTVNWYLAKCRTHLLLFHQKKKSYVPYRKLDSWLTPSSSLHASPPLSILFLGRIVICF